jgi:hypothetical protein
MLRIILVLGLLLAGCMGGEDASTAPVIPAPTTISPGVYQAELNFGPFLEETTLTIEYRFDANKSYRIRVFLAYYQATCLVIDGPSTWAGGSTQYVISPATFQLRSRCDQEFQAINFPGETRPIRNILAASYEEYFEWSDQPARWLRFERI